MAVRIQAEPFDPGTETNLFLTASQGAGAAVTFTGLVRADPTAALTTLTLETYEDMAIGQIAALEAEAVARFGLLRSTVIHRYGALKPGEPIVQVMTLAPHRQAAFDAAQFLMDHLKTDAPFWKKESGARGEHWVEHNAADDAAKSRWRG